eukprot:239636_1
MQQLICRSSSYLFRYGYRFSRTLFRNRYAHNINMVSVSTIHLKPDDEHRIYATSRRSTRAKKLVNKNKFMHKIVISLFVSLTLLSAYTLYQCMDLIVPISHRKRFLIIPNWMESVISQFFMKYVFVRPDDAEISENIEWDFSEGAVAFTEKMGKNNENELMKLSEHSDKYYIFCDKVFQNILMKNNLKKPAANNSSVSEDNNEYRNELSKFHNFEWEVNIIDEYCTINACSLSNGKIFFYKGIFAYNFISNEEECAAVMCHEIAHCICRHFMEGIQLKLLLLSGVYFCGLNFGIDTSFFLDKILLLLLKNVFLELPFSKYCEYEADEIGMILYKNAGYDCNKYAATFEKMAQIEGNIEEALQMFSTHPLTRDRVTRLQQQAAELTV